MAVRNALFLIFSSQQGLILLEILAALLLIAISFTMVLGLFGPMWRSYTSAKNITVATNVAQGIVDGLKHNPNRLIPGVYDSVAELNLPVVVPVGFSVEVEISPKADEPGLFKVIVTVTWQEKERPRQVTVMNYLARP
ncbi:MAG: hypothetical protein HPY81_01805 [Firmicutes bacterium]|nr:hypothetical protein [Bacillota bacterium]